TPDNRIIFGGGRVAVPSRRDQSVAPAISESAWQRMAIELRTIFPGLAELEITDRWSGRIGSILDRLPRLGRLPAAPGVWFSGGWCGHGIPLSVEAGAEIARRISRPPAGTRTGIGTGPGTGTGTEIAWYREKVPQLPGGPLRDLGLKGYLAGLDRIDRLGGKFGGAASSARQLQAASASGR
ncbi:MAG: FAD-dependent oxidoreductase, partial [Nakamurella sp.]